MDTLAQPRTAPSRQLRTPDPRPDFDDLPRERQLEACAEAFSSGFQDDLYQDAARESISVALDGDALIRRAFDPAYSDEVVGRQLRDLLVRYYARCAAANQDDLTERLR